MSAPLLDVRDLSVAFRQDGRDMLEREYKRWAQAGDVLHIVQDGVAEEKLERV